MSSIRKKENELFKEWEKERSDLVRDGIVSEPDYLMSEHRTLLILKEVNDQGGGNWDLREYVRNGPRSSTWNAVTRWMIGISNLSSDLHWEQLKKVNQQDRIDSLKSLAVLNLKKSPGGGSSKSETIKHAAKNDRELLNIQFQFYNPNIVICGGTGNTVAEVIDLGKSAEWKNTSRGISYCKFGPDNHLFRFHHPQARYPATFKYYGLLDAIREVKGYIS